MAVETQTGTTHAETEHPMESPGPILAVVAAIAILVLGGLMATDFIWTAQHPVTTAHAPTHQAPPPAG